LPHRLRKIRKQRGSRTCGWGQISQHRKSGSRGGHGKAGIHKGRWDQNNPKWQPRVGFRCPTGRVIRSINLRDLSGCVSSTSENTGDGIETIDLTAFGYDKLLGAGRVSRPLRIKVVSASESAIRKVSEAGGEVVISE
jgi:large subunit ribosomal protein L15